MSVMRTIATIAATLVASTGLVAMTAGPAAADSPTCVSKTEFRNVKQGFAKKRVHDMFDVAGRQTSWYSGYGDTYESRDYRPCVGRPYSFVSVDYENGRVSSKYAYWG